MTQQPCQLLPWDSGFWGFRIARVVGNTLTPESIPLIDKFCRRKGVRCLYFLATIEEPTTTPIAEEHGFHYVDTRITLEHRLPVPHDSNANAKIRLSKLDDIPILMTIAGNSHAASRFFFDLNFPRHLCAQLYQTWVKVSCEGTYAQAVFVAEVHGVPAAYLTCHVDKAPAAGRIGLLGVGEQAQRQGLGRSLVHGALEWFSNQGLTLSTVVTQGRNLGAQRLYQRCGYITQSVQLWYHKWYPPMEG
jgi:dTDP-4-amino-4,6-dideoxy-D-galactose acyltransferase